MPVSVFIIECATDLQGLDLERVRYDVSAYLREQQQFSSFHEPQVASDGDSLATAMTTFIRWAHTLPPDDIVILWVSMHGKRPPTPDVIGTSGQIGTQEIEWYKAVSSCVGKWHPNTIVILDVCWGGSPTFPRTTGQGPKFIFGPTREARRIELDAAARLIIGRAGKNETFPKADAMSIVNVLNSAFSPNQMGAPFYRVWYMDNPPKWDRYPDPFA